MKFINALILVQVVAAVPMPGHSEYAEMSQEAHVEEDVYNEKDKDPALEHHLDAGESDRDSFPQISKFEYIVPINGEDPKQAMITLNTVTETDKAVIFNKSPYKDADPSTILDRICEHFNEDRQVKYLHTGDKWFGNRYMADELVVTIVNNVPTLLRPAPDKKYRKSLMPRLGKDITVEGWNYAKSIYYERNGHIIINVPANMYAVATVGTGREPRIYMAGLHVIHDTSFRLVNASGDKISRPEEENDPNSIFVDVNTPIIQNGRLCIVRVDPMYVQPIQFNGQHAMLYPTKDGNPYYLTGQNIKPLDPQRLDMRYIQSGEIHILKIPSGMVARVAVNGEPELLEFRSEPFEFRATRFELGEFANISEPVIKWKTVTWITVPSGRVAINRVHGQYKTQLPGPRRKWNDGNFQHIALLDTNVQMQTYPSQAQIDKSHLRRDDPERYITVVSTSDGLRLGIRLFVGYQITDPIKLLQSMDLEEYEKLIEDMATTDLGRAISTVSNADVLGMSLPAKQANSPPEYGISQAIQNDIGPNNDLHIDADKAQPVIKATANYIHEELREQLAAYGITLIKLVLESPKILNEEIARQREQNSNELLATRVKLASAMSKSELANLEAKREIESRLIKQRGENEIAQLKADQEMAIAQVEAEKRRLQTRVEREALEKEGDIYRKRPEMLQLALAKVAAEGMNNAQLVMTNNADMPAYLGQMFPMRPSRNEIAAV